jgi:hypothetical protein
VKAASESRRRTGATARKDSVPAQGGPKRKAAQRLDPYEDDDDDDDDDNDDDDDVWPTMYGGSTP